MSPPVRANELALYWLPLVPCSVSDLKSCRLALIYKWLRPVAYWKNSFLACASRRQSCAPRADGQRQRFEESTACLLGEPGQPRPLGISSCCRSFWESFPTESFLIGFPPPLGPHPAFIFVHLFSLALWIETLLKWESGERGLQDKFLTFGYINSVNSSIPTTNYKLIE